MIDAYQPEMETKMLSWKRTDHRVNSYGDNALSALEFISAQIAELYNK
jgi:hypothetical protein